MMTEAEKMDPQPEFYVEPEHLDFGEYRPNNPLTNQTSLMLTITNRGNELLKGRIITQVSWVILSHVEIECAPGESASYRVQMSTGAPQHFQRQAYRSESCLWIDTNRGLKNISASYHIGPVKNQISHKPFSAGFWLIPVVLVMILIGLLSLIPAREENPDTAHTPEAFLYTSGAQTVLARVTTTAETEESRTSSQTPPAETILSDAEEPLAEGEATFTPWPREAFLNPEQLVQNYFREINAGQYERAWAMLTKNFQQTCCAISGNDPFVIYSTWWSHNIEQVEVKSAFLQAWDQNPAPVLVSLSYYYMDGKIEDLVFMYYIIADEERNTLLIDVVE